MYFSIFHLSYNSISRSIIKIFFTIYFPLYRNGYGNHCTFSFLAFNEHPFYFLVSREASEELIGIVESFCKEDSYALVDDMSSALNACDVVIGKAGGMSTSETLASGKPFGIWVHNGPEDFNAEYLIRKKFGKKIGGTVELLKDFEKTKQWILSAAQQGKSAFVPKDGADKIAKLALAFFNEE